MSSRVGSLKIYTETKKDKIEELPAKSTRYSAVESIIDLGLSVLETPEGRESLVNVAVATITQRREKKKHHLYGNHSLDDMPMWINEFLTRLRGSFPDIYIVKMEGEGMAIKYEWGDDMASYYPKSAAELRLNRTILHNIIGAEPQAGSHSYDMFRFQMVVTVAHEIIHFLIGYLTGKKQPHTPPEVSLAPYGTMGTGESGRYWESLLLGGVVEFYEDSRDPLGNMQAGTPYLIADGRKSAPARLISTNYVNEFLSGNFSFPIRTSSTTKPTTRSELRKISRETSVLRRGRNATTNTSPGRPSTSFAERSDPAASCGGMFQEGEASGTGTASSSSAYSSGPVSSALNYSSASYSSASMSYNQDTTYPSVSMSYNQDTTYPSASTSYNQDTTYCQEAGGTDGGAYNQNTSASVSGSQWVSTGSDVEGQRYRWWDGVQYTDQFC